MVKLCANLSMMFTEDAFLDRFGAAAEVGFKGVEYLFPYAFDKNQLADKLAENDLTQVLFNLPAGNWEAGERGIAAFPDRIGEFQEGVGQAIEYAVALGCMQLNVLSGIVRAEVDTDKTRETYIGNIRFAAEELKKAGIKLLIEAINTRDMPDFYVSRTRQALHLIDLSGSDNIFVQYDIYHMQRMEGELAATMQEYLSRIAHIQLADNPGRNEPGSGEINYPFLLGFLDRIGYSGWIGCEYKPSSGTVAGLGWAKAYL